MQQFVSAALVGTSNWGTELGVSLAGLSDWQTKELADIRGAGGLYTRP